MARPFKKANKWPYVAKSGKKSYYVGFYDHEGTERTKSFPRATGLGSAKQWMDSYDEAERRGKESLRRFLLDLDAKDSNPDESERTLGVVVQHFFAHNHPSQVNGLAPSTFSNYRDMAYRHLLGREGRSPKGETLPPHQYAVDIRDRPASDFNGPDAPRRWRTEMERAGTPTSARIRAWKVLSSILSYAAAEETIPEIRTNGSLLVAERTGTKRRSSRRGGTGQGRSRTTRANRRVGAATRNWALSPMAVELIRHYQLRRTDQRPEILPKRDALVTSLQYGLCLRDQEVFALRWRSVDSADLDDPDLVVIDEVLSWNQLDEGKTSGSVRETHCPELLRDDLNAWRRFLRQSGFRTRANDFIVPGDLGGSYRGKPIGIPDEESGGYHFSSNMVKKWHQKFFAPAVEQASASDAKYADILGATPYSLRRGGISLRLRTEDAQTVADECGTSLQMLDKHYAFSLKDMDRLNRLPMDDEWRAARASVEGNFKTPPRLRVVA